MENNMSVSVWLEELSKWNNDSKKVILRAFAQEAFKRTDEAREVVLLDIKVMVGENFVISPYTFDVIKLTNREKVEHLITCGWIVV